MAMEAQQVDCRGCGAKVDIHAGLRTKTFVCEYCGSVCDGEKVVAVQDMQAKREENKPWSHLRLGMTAPFLGHEYQLIGRIRAREKTWWWDEWFMYSKSGFPLWLQEGEGGFTIFRVFYPTYPINPWTAGTHVKLDNQGGNAKVQERGTGTVSFIEGELTWSSVPGETFNYIECWRKKVRYSIEYTEQEIQYLRGESRDSQEVYNKFRIQEAVPPPMTFDDDDDDDWDEDSNEPYQAEAASESTPMGAGTKFMAVAAILLGLFLMLLSGIVGSFSKHFKSYHFNAQAATGQGDGVLLTDDKGKPIAFKLPKTTGAYELRLASSPTGQAGWAGGYCWWAQVDFLKERSKAELAKIEKYLKSEGEKMDEWTRFQTVHRVSAWFGRYWGIDEGERWNENNFVRQHYFRTKDPGPYYIRVYADNCTDYTSRRFNPVKQASLTVAFYKNVWMTRWIFWGGVALTVIVILGLIWRFRSAFSDD
ncbi:MAG: DUF4178 domain-containing protein [bacterium]